MPAGKAENLRSEDAISRGTIIVLSVIDHRDRYRAAAGVVGQRNAGQWVWSLALVVTHTGRARCDGGRVLRRGPN